MRFSTAPLLMGFLLAVLASGALAQRTWIVDASGGGDFVAIQPAIDAAADGDLVLVRATGIYDGFSLGKGVLIRAASTPFAVGPSLVEIHDVDAPRTAGISGMEMDFEVFKAYPQLRVRSCRAEVVLEHVQIHRSDLDEPHDAYTALRIQDCGNVSVDHLLVPPSDSRWYGAPTRKPDPAVVVLRSRVRMSDVLIGGVQPPTLESYCHEGFDGGDGLLVDHSILTLASPTIVGADGGYAIGLDGSCGAKHGDGGAGVVVDASKVLILGREDDLIQGGDGQDCGFYGETSVSHGGDGLVVLRGDVTVSRVQLRGGEGGGGHGCSGRDGEPFVGPVQRLDVMAVMDLTQDLHPGDAYTIDVDAVEQGQAVLIVSEIGGWWRPLPAVIGPDLSAIPGGVFLVFSLGRTDAFGDLSWSARLSGDPATTGLSTVFQIAVLADSGSSYLTNSVTRVLGE